MHEDDLRLEIKKLAFRLQRLERHVGIEPAKPESPREEAATLPGARPAASSAPPPMQVVSPQKVTTPPAAQPAAPPIKPAVSPPPQHVAPAKRAVPAASSQSSPPPSRLETVPPSAAAPPHIAQHQAQRSEPPEKPGSIEFALGIKGLGSIGAILVVIGAAFLAREYGANIWFSLPAWVQAMSIACFGGLLLLGGEIALRKLGKPASLGLYGAGLGVLYMDAFATFQWFEIVSRDASFLLMALVAACGFAITLRTKFLSIGVLSLIGGYIAPVILRHDATGGLQVLAFLTMLAGIALALSAWQPRPFRPLRYVAFGGQCFLGLIAVLAHAQAQPVVILVFSSIWWTMFTAEAVLAAMRRQSPTGNVVVSLLGTAAYVTCAAWILNAFTTVGSHYLGAYTAMIAVLCGAIAMHFGPGLDGLRGRLDTAMDKLAVALWAQMGVLLTIAIAMQFDGYGPSVGWLALGLASIEIGRRLPSTGVSVFGLIVLGLGVMRAATIDQFSNALAVELWTAGDLRIDHWAILGLLTVLAIHAAAKRVGGKSAGLQQSMPVILATLGAIGWFILAARQSTGLTLTSLWVGGAVLMLAIEQWNRREKYLEISLLMLLAAAAKWLLIDAMARRLSPGWNAGEFTPMLNPQMGMAIAIAAAGWWGLRRIDVRSRMTGAAEQTAGIAWQAAAIIGSAFLLVGLSFEVDRAVLQIAQMRTDIAWTVGHMRQLLFTLLWAFGSAAFGMLAMMLRRQWSSERPGTGTGTETGTGMPLLLRFAWGVLAACAVKWIVVDTLVYTFVLDRPQILAFQPLVNVQLFVGAVLATIAIALLSITSRTAPADQSGAWTPLRAFTSIAACVIVLWGLTFEVDRLLGRMALDAAYAWPDGQLRALWWGALWAAGGLLMIPLGRWRGVVELSAAGRLIAVLAGAFWLLFGALMWRLGSPPVAAPVILNVHFLTGTLVTALLAASLYLARNIAGSGQYQRGITALTLALIAALGFIIVSLEIDRGWADNVMAKQMGLSISWALYGAALVLLGFVRLSAPSRYVGLALLFITIVKILLIDMATADQLWRVLSFIVSGLLFIATSMAYAKLSPKLLATLASRAQSPA